MCQIKRATDQSVDGPVQTNALCRLLSEWWGREEEGRGGLGFDNRMCLRMNCDVMDSVSDWTAIRLSSVFRSSNITIAPFRELARAGETTTHNYSPYTAVLHSIGHG